VYIASLAGAFCWKFGLHFIAFGGSRHPAAKHTHPAGRDGYLVIRAFRTHPLVDAGPGIGPLVVVLRRLRWRVMEEPELEAGEICNEKPGAEANSHGETNRKMPITKL